MVVGWVSGLCRALRRLWMAASPRHAPSSSRDEAALAPLGPLAELGPAAGLAGAAGLRLGRAVGDDEPCLPGRGGDPVLVGRAAGALPGDVHHRLRSRALVSPPADGFGRGGCAAAFGHDRRVALQHQLSRRAGDLLLGIVFVVHVVPRRIGAAQARCSAADVVLLDDFWRRSVGWNSRQPGRSDGAERLLGMAAGAGGRLRAGHVPAVRERATRSSDRKDIEPAASCGASWPVAW